MHMIMKHLAGLNSVLLKWAVVPLLTFLLAGLATNKLLKAKRGFETERFKETFNESLEKFNAGDREGALRGLERAEKMAPGDLAERAGLVNKFQALGEHKRAAEVIERSLRGGPKERQTALNYARLCEYYLEHGDLENAKRVLAADLIARWPEALETVYVQGEVALKSAIGKSDIEVAMKHFEKSAALDPGHLPSKMQLGIAYWRLGQLEKAEPMLRAAWEKRPSDPVVLYHLGEVLRQQGKPEEARTYLDEHKRLTGLDQRRKDLQVQYSLGKYQPADLLELARIYGQQGEFAKAASTLRVYTRLKPADPEGQRELAQACLKIGDKEGARVATELAEALSLTSKPR